MIYAIDFNPTGPNLIEIQINKGSIIAYQISFYRSSLLNQCIICINTEALGLI